ncbi:hypothetical protein ACFQ36_02555 [Arthrobacter sp. GCM10027362]
MSAVPRPLKHPSRWSDGPVQRYRPAIEALIIQTGSVVDFD